LTTLTTVLLHLPSEFAGPPNATNFASRLSKTCRMIRTGLFLLLLLPMIGFSQTYINLTEKQIKKEWEKNKVNDCKHTFQRTDTALVVSVDCANAAKNPIARFIYSFDASKKCQWVQMLTESDSFFTATLEKTLLENYNWKKINENQYISDFESHRLIELPADNRKNMFIVFRMDWTRQLYDLLTGNK
jgi:hypothetical protein